MSTPLLLVQGLTVRLSNRTILHQIDLEVHLREIVTIIGPNGAGKSTLLEAVLGLVPWTAGHCHYHPDLRIGYVPQRVHVDATLPLPVAHFIDLSHVGTEPLMPPQDFLDALGCDVLMDRPLSVLSGGEMQRVLLARALARRPNLLVLDEPAQGMDVAGEKLLFEFLEFLRRERNMGLLLVSHNLHFVMAATDRVICLNHHICCSGTPLAVCSDPEFLALFPSRTKRDTSPFGADLDGFGLYQHQHSHDHQHALKGVLPSLSKPGRWKTDNQKTDRQKTDKQKTSGQEGENHRG